NLTHAFHSVWSDDWLRGWAVFLALPNTRRNPSLFLTFRLHQRKANPANGVKVYRVDIGGSLVLATVYNFVAIPFFQVIFYQPRPADDCHAINAPELVEHVVPDVVCNPFGIAVAVFVQQRFQVDCKTDR